MAGTGHAPLIEVDRCTGCGRCVAACSLRLFTLETSGRRKHAFLTAPERCSRCGRCVAECPVGALSLPPHRNDLRRH